MATTNVLASLSSIAALALTVSSCGGAAPAPTTPAADSPAEKCFALAGAKREKSPTEPAKITMRHVLVVYTGAKNARATTPRTREQACLRALEARDELRGGAEFPEVVKKFSDEPGAATRDGMVGTVERKDIAAPVADAAFELHPKEFSDVVESPFGFHVIMRTE